MATATAHRKNKDGTWDSICLACFMTIAQAGNEAALKEQELQHTCHPLEFLREADRHRQGHDTA